MRVILLTTMLIVSVFVLGVMVSLCTSAGAQEATATVVAIETAVTPSTITGASRTSRTERGAWSSWCIRRRLVPQVFWVDVVLKGHWVHKALQA